MRTNPKVSVGERFGANYFNGKLFYSQTPIWALPEDAEEARAKVEEHPNSSLTKEGIRAKILDVLPLAQARMQEMEIAFQKFQQEQDVEIDYNIEGDTHGIYEEGMSCGFTLQGFYFTFYFAR